MIGSDAAHTDTNMISSDAAHAAGHMQRVRAKTVCALSMHICTQMQSHTHTDTQMQSHMHTNAVTHSHRHTHAVTKLHMHTNAVTHSHRHTVKNVQTQHRTRFMCTLIVLL